MSSQRQGILLAHLSDVHLPLPTVVSPFSVFNKRLLSLLSWHTKRSRDHLKARLDQLVADLLDHEPDLIAVTGDLTNLGLDIEYRGARAWLETLGDPARVTVIPGNHEALVRGAWDSGAAQWRPYWQGDDDTGAAVAQAFPTLRLRGPLALIGMSSAIPSPPGQAVGAVGPAQRTRLAEILSDSRGKGLCRVVLIHHPPLDGTVTRRKRLRDTAEVTEILAREGVELVLHGHSHKSHHQTLQTRDGPAPVIGVPSASSMRHEAAAYNLYRVTPTGTGWEISLTPRYLAAGGMRSGPVETLTLARAHAAK
ncbi:metallophosphoesterase family protein [Roseovarius sp. D22-M7]|uniref:metallophosphoesterase family protein n=1 Tax=Roseovarius sp. D22-M7 TaxID=3127116 RepID=UPI003010233E